MGQTGLAEEVQTAGGGGVEAAQPLVVTAGPRLLNFNVEYRTPPWVFKTLHLGLVVFYDAGDTYGFTRDTDFTYHQSLGIGLRGLFPQFDRGVLRLDIGIPLGRDFHSHVIDWVTIAFLQAF